MTKIKQLAAAIVVVRSVVTTVAITLMFAARRLTEGIMRMDGRTWRREANWLWRATLMLRLASALVAAGILISLSWVELSVPCLAQRGGMGGPDEGMGGPGMGMGGPGGGMGLGGQGAGFGRLRGALERYRERMGGPGGGMGKPGGGMGGPGGGMGGE